MSFRSSLVLPPTRASALGNRSREFQQSLHPFREPGRIHLDALPPAMIHDLQQISRQAAVPAVQVLRLQDDAKRFLQFVKRFDHLLDGLEGFPRIGTGAGGIGLQPLLRPGVLGSRVLLGELAVDDDAIERAKIG